MSDSTGKLAACRAWLASPPSRRAGRAIVAAVPVVLVNAVAFAGQLAFLRARLPWTLPGQVTVALALESIAVYLAWHAHVAQLANDPSLRLRLSAYGFALVIATMNYSHYAARGWRPTFPALAVGLMSAASPWLWSVHSRRTSRDRLMAAGLIEPHALRLGATRWTWHPLRSARVMWHATWAGVADPQEAILRWGRARQNSRARTPAPVSPDAVSDGGEVTLPGPPSEATAQPPRQRQPAATDRAAKRAKADRLVAASPAITPQELAPKCGVSERTAQRWLADIRRPRLVAEG